MKTNPIIPPYYMVFDVESIGLHGDAFAVGFTVVTWAGCEVAFENWAVDPKQVLGDESDRQWVRENISLPVTHKTIEGLHADFWNAWMKWKALGALLVTDCGWPVEANFLSSLINYDPEARKWDGPYPLHDIASIIMANGGDPLATNPRLPHELPAHNPLNDARQSARIMLEHLRKLEPQPMGQN